MYVHDVFLNIVIVVVAQDEDDFANSAETEGRVQVGGSVTGEIETRGDQDAFAVTLQEGLTYRIDLQGADTELGTLQDPRLWGIFDSQGDRVSLLSDDDGVGLNGRLFFTPETGGTYFISCAGFFGDTGTYTLSVTLESSADESESVETGGLADVGGFVSGEVGGLLDDDWFAVTLRGGVNYAIDLLGADTSDGTLEDPVLRGIHDADGNRIENTTNDDGGVGFNSRLFFTPETDGTYYISAGGFLGDTGSFRLWVEGDEDDYAESAETNARVGIGGSATGRNETVADADWFAVTMKANVTYRIDLEGASTRLGTLKDPRILGIYDSTGTAIADTDDDGGVFLNSRLIFTPDTDGTYYISAGRGSLFGAGDYTLSVSLHKDDYAAGSDTEGAVEVGGSVTGEIQFGFDSDWFAVTLKAGESYRIDLEGADTDMGTLQDPGLVGIYDTKGDRIAGPDRNSGEGRNSQLIFTPETDGSYYIATVGTFGDTGTYKLSVQADDSDGTGSSSTADTWTNDDSDGTGANGTADTRTDDYPASADTVGMVEVGGSVMGDIEADGDRDWFAVTLKAGQSYRIDLEGAPTGQGTLKDPYLVSVYDADGNRIANTRNDDGGIGLNSRVPFTPRTDGTYYVSAGEVFGATGTYTLSVTATKDDYPASADTDGTAEVGGSVTGDIEVRGDRDWFAVTLQAGVTYRIDLEGADTGEGTLENPILNGIYRADGAYISGTYTSGTYTWSGGKGNNVQLIFTPETDGTYYMSANAVFGETGTYTLSVTEHFDDYLAGTDTDGVVEVGASVTGEIEWDGDRDWFAVTLHAGVAYRIDLEGADTDKGTLEDPYLRGIYDAGGRYIYSTLNSDGGIGLNSRVVFTPETDGTYYMSANAVFGETGTYTLSVTELSDDYSASTHTDGVVDVGGSVTGEIEWDGDRDWFAVALKAGVSYRIDLEGTATDKGTLEDPYLSGIYDADGDYIFFTSNFDGGIGLNSRVVFTPETDGTYYVSAGEILGTTGTYTLSVTELSDDYSASTDTDGVVDVGGSVTGEIEWDGDRDWFAVALEAGVSYRIDLEGTATDKGTLRDPLLDGIYDADGNRIANTRNDDGGIGFNSRVVFTPETDGTYYVSAGEIFGATGTYTLSVTEQDDDYSASTDTDGVVDVGGSVTGEIEWDGDRDWFAVALEAGVSYRIDLEGTATDKGTLRDPLLDGIYDADGNRIANTRNDDGGIGFNSRVVFTPETDGTYYVSAGEIFGAIGTYTLSVTEHFDDYLAGTDTDGVVDVGGSVTGEIEWDGDRDWFAVTLHAGVAYRIDLEGADTDKGTLEDPYLRGIYDAGGRYIYSTLNSDGGIGLNSRVVFTPETDGTYYVSAGEILGATGTYTLSVTEQDDDYSASTDTDGVVDVGGSVTGEIEWDGDRDWFAVALEAGVSYRIDLEGTATDKGTLEDPYLSGIYDADGDYIFFTSNFDGGIGHNSREVFTPETDGTYYVSAGGSSDHTGTYSLSVTELSDDYSASTHTDGVVEVGGSVTGEIEWEGDRDWFAVALEAGVSYRIDLEGTATDKGTLRDPLLDGIYDADGNRIANTRNDDGGIGFNSRVVFTPETDGTYYVSAGEIFGATGTYTLSVTEQDDEGGTAIAGGVQADASGEIEEQSAPEQDVEQESAASMGDRPGFEDTLYCASRVWDRHDSAVVLDSNGASAIDDFLDQFVLAIDVGVDWI